MTSTEPTPYAVPIQIVVEDSEQQRGHCTDYGTGTDNPLRDANVHPAKTRPEQGQVGGYQCKLTTAEEITCSESQCRPYRDGFRMRPAGFISLIRFIGLDGL